MPPVIEQFRLSDMTPYRLWLVLLILALATAFFAFDLQRLLSLEWLKSQIDAIHVYHAEHAISTAASFSLIYVMVAGLSLPGATVMALAGGAIFGVIWGTVLVSFTSTIGATLAFLAARFLFRDAVMHRWGERLQTVDAGMARDGPFYLFTLRLVPLFPFFVINLVMGLTALPVRTFYWVSQLGMLAGTFVYVNAGTQLVRVESLSGILSPPLLLSFALLGVFPLLARKWAESLRLRRSSRK
jgi:uncharacterized membrane protein YdjX (TVP38/TMEM64 family)